MKVKLWAAISAWVTVGLIACSSTIIGVMIEGWKNGVMETWQLAAEQTEYNIIEDLESSLNFVKFASRSVPYIEPLMENQNMPTTGVVSYKQPGFVMWSSQKAKSMILQTHFL